MLLCGFAFLQLPRRAAGSPLSASEASGGEGSGVGGKVV
jgi:hypothetical protein